ncbi:MAG: homing endonuclease associated repeat-containing protein [Chloroflexota bacterium]
MEGHLPAEHTRAFAPRTLSVSVSDEASASLLLYRQGNEWLAKRGHHFSPLPDRCAWSGGDLPFGQVTRYNRFGACAQDALHLQHAFLVCAAAAACLSRLRCGQIRYRQFEYQLLPALWQVAESTSRMPSRRKWDRLEPGDPHSTTLSRRFGGWRRATCATGLGKRHGEKKGLHALHPNTCSEYNRAGRPTDAGI